MPASAADRLKAIKDRAAAAKAAPVRRTKGSSAMARLLGPSGGAPHATTGPLGERPYSVTRAVAFAKGLIGPEQAKEEIHAHEVLKGIYAQTTWEYMGRSLLIPTSTHHIPVSLAADTLEPDPVKVKFVGELREKMAAGVAGADPDEANHIRRQIRQKTFGTVSDAAGGSLVGFPTLGEIIDIQRNNEVFAQCGASEYPLPPNGRVAFPKQTNVMTAYMVGEAAQITASDPATGMLNLEAKKMTLLCTLNGELFKFASPAAEQLVRTDMAEVGARKMDQQQLEGTGGTQVLGLLNYQQQTTWAQGNADKVILHTATVTGTDGNTFSFEDPSLMQAKLPDAVGNGDTLAWVMRRLLFGYLRNRRSDAVTAADGKGVPLFNITAGVDEVRGGSRDRLDNTKVVYSNTVSNTRTKGSGTALTYVLLGLFKDWVTARYGVMEVLANPWGDTAFQYDQVQIRGIQRFDAGARHAASFVLCDTLLIA